eukprot:COSAG05_NODE_525_length_8961_cov_212.374591_9_plen_304_part_00
MWAVFCLECMLHFRRCFWFLTHKWCRCKQQVDSGSRPALELSLQPLSSADLSAARLQIVETAGRQAEGMEAVSVCGHPDPDFNGVYGKLGFHKLGQALPLPSEADADGRRGDDGDSVELMPHYCTATVPQPEIHFFSTKKAHYPDCASANCGLTAVLPIFLLYALKECNVMVVVQATSRVCTYRSGPTAGRWTGCDACHLLGNSVLHTACIQIEHSSHQLALPETTVPFAINAIEMATKELQLHEGVRVVHGGGHTISLQHPRRRGGSALPRRPASSPTQWRGCGWGRGCGGGPCGDAADWGM